MTPCVPPIEALLAEILHPIPFARWLEGYVREEVGSGATIETAREENGMQWLIAYLNAVIGNREAYSQGMSNPENGAHWINVTEWGGRTVMVDLPPWVTMPNRVRSSPYFRQCNAEIMALVVRDTLSTCGS